MGSDAADANENEKPVHKVTVASFWLDRTEVTVGPSPSACARGSAVNPSPTRRSEATTVSSAIGVTPRVGRAIPSTAWTTSRRGRIALGWANVCPRKKNGSSRRAGAPKVGDFRGATTARPDPPECLRR